MKVLVVTNMYPTESRPFYGIFVEEQVESLRKEGISVDVEFIDGRGNRLNYFSSVVKLIKRLKRAKYNIIHAHHTYCVYPIMIAKIITGIKTPVILTFHEGEVHKTGNLKIRNGDLIKRLVFSKKIKKYALEMVDLVISVQEELVRELNFSGKYVILPCGVDLDLFQPMDKNYCRKRLDLPLDKKIIFFPASPSNFIKGADILNEAIRNLKRSEVYLVTAGDIRHEDMPCYMCAADIIVQLSIWEASPMVLKEAMAVNVLVIFAEAGDATVLSRDTKGIFLCKRDVEDVTSKLEQALEYSEESDGRRRIVDAGLGLSEISKKIISVYKDITLNSVNNYDVGGLR